MRNTLSAVMVDKTIFPDKLSGGRKSGSATTAEDTRHTWQFFSITIYSEAMELTGNIRPRDYSFHRVGYFCQQNVLQRG